MSNYRNGIIDIWRFIACISIVLSHAYLLGVDVRAFSTAWIFVEFFFVLTGYYTLKHFANHPRETLDAMAKNALTYTIRKFLVFFPYVVLAIIPKTVFGFIVNGQFDVRKLTDVILETSLLTRGQSTIGSFWYLAALLAALPLYAFLCQMKSKNVLYLLAFCYALGYYNLTLGDHVVVFPAYIFRAFGGLFLGSLVYALSEVIKPRIQSTRGNISCIVFAQAALGIVLCGGILAEQNTLFYIVCIFIGVTLILSAKQVNFGQRCGRIIAYLGKVSMVIYIVHVPMAYFLEYVGKMTGLANTWYLIALQLMSVLLVSCILYTIVEKVREKLKLALDVK